MGAGHDGAARSLAEQLQAAGHPAEVRDFLRSGPLRIGSALRRGYEFELKHVPSAYDATYRFWYRVPWLCPVVAWLVTVLTRRTVLRWVEESGARTVVSTYPLSTLCLGRLRQRGHLAVPVVNFITDFGVHPLWVHPGVDLNLAIHPDPAAAAEERSGRRAVACGPAVSPNFDPDRIPAKAEARAKFGLRPGQRAVLVVAGSWGVGDLRATWEAIAAEGEFYPVVVCGRDDRLRREMAALADKRGLPSLVLGWTDEMPALMAACDAMVENAGGLTSLEAMRAGLPVVSFDPIAGHGKENTAAMDQVGVARLAHTRADLRETLAAVTSPGPARADQVERARAMFHEAPARLVQDLTLTPLRPVVAGRGRLASAMRAAALVSGLGGLGWAGLTTGVAMATEAGAGVAHPAPGTATTAYVGVRVDAVQLTDSDVIAQLRRMHATAVVDEDTAAAAPGAVRSVVRDGIGVADGGMGEAAPGEDTGAPWTRARGDARAGAAISSLIGSPVRLSVPGRRLTAWDLIECRDAHMSLVVPDHILRVGSWADDQPIHVSAGSIYLVNGLRASPAQLVAFLSRLQSSLAAADLVTAPLGGLG